MVERIQLRRSKGWRKPAGAVVVSRPSKWGNPFKIGEEIRCDSPLWPYITSKLVTGEENSGRGLVAITPLDPRMVVDAYAYWLYEQPPLMLTVNELTGRDLACFCPLEQPCHADVLLGIANEGEGD